MSSDIYGHQLLAHRLEQIPGELAGMIVRGLPQLRPGTLAAEQFVVTGTGSSEAHARYFTHLINLNTDRTAIFLPLSAFLNPSLDHMRDRTLVVFTQGLSPNAQIALRRHADFAHTILFTSITPVAARAAGKPDRADLITDVVEAGGDLVLFPLAEEYSTLIRFVGPMCGYLVCQQFIAQLSQSDCAPPRPGQILPLLDHPIPADLEEAILNKPELFRNGFNLVCAAPISDFAQNLACKFMEGLFWQCPQVSDFLQFAHGPFQQASAQPRPIVVLQGELPVENELVARSAAMAKSASLPFFVVKVNAYSLYSIFGFESVFNQLIMKAMVKFNVDQLNWPGKGRDDALYGFCSDPGTKNVS